MPAPPKKQTQRASVEDSGGTRVYFFVRAKTKYLVCYTPVRHRRSNLRRAISKGIKTPGRSTILSDYEECELVGYALNMQHFRI